MKAEKLFKTKKGTKLKVTNKLTKEVEIVTYLHHHTLSQIKVKDPNGKEKILEILNFIIETLPLIDRIIDWIKGLFKRRK